MRLHLIVLGGLFIATGTVAAELSEAVESVTPRAIEYRHTIHANPELGNREDETAALVAEHLKSLGMEVRTRIAHTGVLGILKGGKPGSVIAIRADMDALPVKEQSGLPFASTVTAEYRGQPTPVAHACGHDVHTAVQMGVASVLAGMREQLPGTVLFVFQPAEEGAPVGEEGGAKLMLEENVFGDYQPEAIFALHADPSLQVGEIGWVSGPIWASSDQFLIEIKGTQTHGAYPHLGVDPIVTAAQAIMAFQTIISRTLDPREPAVLTVGIIEGGERFNIIPDNVHLEGTVRTYSEDVQAKIEQRMHEVLDGITLAAGADYTMQYIAQTPPTINDEGLAAWAKPVLESVVGAGNVIEQDPQMGAEDFAYFARQYPGFYYRLGVEDPQHPSGAIHTPTFRASDAAVPVGIKTMSKLVVNYLRDHSGNEPAKDL